MLSHVRVTAKYQITLPSELRHSLNIDIGDRLIFRKNAHGDIVVESMKQASANDLLGALRRTDEKTSD
jgi:AbrB family looped-hinge helix DNA binding protein